MDNTPTVDSVCTFIHGDKGYDAQVQQVIDMETAKNRYFVRYNKEGFMRQLSVLWEGIVDESHQHAKKTDKLVLCSIPKFSCYWIWFARGVNGEWLALPIHSEDECGRLYVG